MVIFICSATYNGASALPQVLAGKCGSGTCTTLTNDLDVVKTCMNDFTDAACTYNTAATIPTKLNQVRR